jgi:DNA-binding Xre family transcriptional regulator
MKFKFTKEKAMDAEIQNMLADRNLRKISAVTGVSQPTLARLRDGAGPFRQSTLLKIAAYLGIIDSAEASS